MISTLFAILFGVSLLPGRKPLCLWFAERISGGIMPDGAKGYCRRLTWIWFLVLLACSLSNVWLSSVHGRIGFATASILTPVVIVCTFAMEKRVRGRHFSVTFHTSGSTSAPKTIVKTFESLAREVAFHRDRLSIPHDVAFLSTVEWGHMYGKLWCDMLPKAVGCKCDPEVILSPETLVSKMSGAQKVFLVTTPSFLKRFCAYADLYDVPRNCAFITTSGSLLDAETSHAARRVFGVAPMEIFGSTETGGVAARVQDGGVSRYDWEVFSPVKVKSSPDGRLVVRSPFSYVKDYVMGDGVELAPDRRHFKLLGRKDRMVKIAEQRVSLPEMEERMRSLDCVEDAALVALDGKNGAYLGAVVVSAGRSARCGGGGNGAADPHAALALRKLLIPIFPKGTAPKRYRFVDEIPRNAQGKVLASSLRDMFGG